MGALASIYLKKETIKTILETLTAKNEKGIELTVSINDDTNQYGQNVTAFVAQSKEDREAKKQKYYVGNGKVFWNDGLIKNAVKIEQAEPATEAITPSETETGLPF